MHSISKHVAFSLALLALPGIAVADAGKKEAGGLTQPSVQNPTDKFYKLDSQQKLNTGGGADRSISHSSGSSDAIERTQSGKDSAATRARMDGSGAVGNGSTVGGTVIDKEGPSDRVSDESDSTRPADPHALDDMRDTRSLHDSDDEREPEGLHELDDAH